MHWLDIDETRNRILVAVRDETIVPLVVPRIAALGIPSAAFTVEAHPLPIARSRSLTDMFRPPLGGIQIRAAARPNAACTLGFNAEFTGYWGLEPPRNVFVTASHCTAQTFALDLGAIHQPVVASGNLVGHEIGDRELWNCDWQGLACRRSDASIIEYVGSVLSERRIVRTQFHGIGQRGSLNEDSTNPYWSVTSAAGFLAYGAFDPPVGAWINKVGQTSGWTRGQVTQTCVSLQSLRCQTVSTVWSEHGDSGSPMFRDSANSGQPSSSNAATLLGVLWGGPGGDWNTTWHSPLANIENDLGSLYPCETDPTTCFGW